jgi:hypothetical protein
MLKAPHMPTSIFSTQKNETWVILVTLKKNIWRVKCL